MPLRKLTAGSGRPSIPFALACLLRREKTPVRKYFGGDENVTDACALTLGRAAGSFVCVPRSCAPVPRHRPKTSSWCDGRFASLERVPRIRDEAESALMQWVAYQCRCEGRFAFSPLEAAECKIMPQFCTSVGHAAAARDPQPLASPGALDSLPSRTKSPETPSVAYHLFALRPSCF